MPSWKRIKFVLFGQKPDATDDRVQLDSSKNLLTSDTAAQFNLAAIFSRLPSAFTFNRLRASDQFTGEESLDDKTSDGNVSSATFNFLNGAPDLVWVTCTGGTGRACMGGDTPSATKGRLCPDAQDTPITFSGSSTLKVFAASGVKVTVVGYRYT